MRRAAKRDISEQPVVRILRRLGWSVLRISDKGAPDLLIGRGSHMQLVEVKTGKGTLTKDQKDWHASWLGPKVLIFRDATDVLNFHNSLLHTGRV